MLELTAVFEEWFIGDGNYPPLYKGMAVNLSFQVQPDFVSPAKSSEKLSFTHLGDAEYDFCGEVLRIYDNLAIIDTGAFRFYIETPEVSKFTPGLRLSGSGTLLLDYYIWVEFLDRYLNPPDIFFTLEVTRIRKVQIPEDFITRYEKGKSGPTRLPPEDFGIISEIETMAGQKSDEVFYLVDFIETDRRDVPRTFL